MPTWTRAELETAFQHYQDEVEKACATRDWDLFAALFTEDATYVEHAYGNFEGREAIRTWITRTMTEEFPGNEMPHFPIDWYVVDEERGRIVCEVFNQLADVGDGKRHGASNITILTYAGDNRVVVRGGRLQPGDLPARGQALLQGGARAGHALGRGRGLDDRLRWRSLT